MQQAGNRISVTGGTGFIGRSVLAQLPARGFTVKALARKPRERGDIEWVDGTLEDEHALKALAEGTDTFIHIAGLTKAPNLAGLLKVNETGARNAVRAARAANVRRFILVSSIAAREPHLSDYAKSKRAGEEAVRDELLQSAGPNLELLIVRPPAIIGPGDEATRPMLNILRRGFLPAPSGQSLKTGRMSFIYMDDIARFLIDLIDSPWRDDPLTPHGGTPSSSWHDLAATASKVLSKRVRVIPVPNSILKIAAITAQTLTGLFRKSGFFNAGKVRELLHTDWTGDIEISGALTLEQALRLSFEMDAE